ncbi:hypothetical protein [Streptomyces sp. NPDC029003]|uniref:hypothetical protein n=1 Tax=Streptomyces sp. NPDC029003 TaxID=3155125 RepID=UPI0033EA025B
MPGTTRNRRRAAELCSEATGTPYRTCLNWASQEMISRTLPVPDAATADQRTTESLMVCELADGLRESEQRGGALFGFTRARPTRTGLLLGLHPATADRVLALLLPRIDERYGGLRGVPGLRLVPHGRYWALTRVQGNAVVHLAHPDAEWQPELPVHGAGLTQLWRRNRHRLHPAESARLDDRTGTGGDAGRATAQDWLNSRLLRRPRLLGLAGAAHGAANTYTHGSGQVVVEWCCGVERGDLERQLRASGLAVRPDGIREHPRDRQTFTDRVAMGGAHVTLRKAVCAYPYASAASASKAGPR